ncbi:hypothetical protein QCA50_006746 [Cerrena zonata]|uniref:F-box domain-containing protein n=1 Tax=Cerrena zonata TaxID=2478898 RepID=A0AAW0GLY9_9APHY
MNGKSIGNLVNWLATGRAVDTSTLKPPPPPPPPPPADGRCIINELPTELLSYIFDLGQLHSDDTENKPFGVLASHVCRLWREVAINQPTLWNVIPLVIPGILKEIENSKVILATYLERAREAPLDIAIDLDTFLDDLENEVEEDEDITSRPELQQLHEIISMIVPRHKQLRSFEVSVSDFLLMAAALKFLESIPEAPLLESFSLYNHDDFDDLRFFEPVRFAGLRVLPFHGNAPRLKNVALWGVHLDWEQCSQTLFKDLEELELAYHPEDVRPTYKQYARILAQSPNLRSFELCHSGPAGGMVEWSENVREGSSPGDPPVSIPRITLHSLTDLVLSYEDQEVYLKDLLDYLDAPNVTELTLDLSAEDDTEIFRKLSTAPPKGKSLLQGLTVFKLTECSCSTEVVRSALRSLENVTQLNLNFNYLDTAWLHILSGRADGENVQNPQLPCPKLETIMLRGIDGEDILDFAQRRTTAGLPLKKILIDETDRPDLETEIALKHITEVEYFEGSDTEEDESDVTDDEDEFYIGLEDDLDEGADISDLEEDDGNAEWTDDDDDDSEEDLHFLD